MKKTLSILILLSGLLSLGYGAYGQNSGGISAEMLSEISKGWSGSPSDVALRNALNAAQINVLSTSTESIAMIDTHFSDEVKTFGRTDQKSSGRCWLFTGLNVLRSKASVQHDLGEWKLSQNYNFFYDQLEKANLFLQGVIDTRNLPFEDRKVDWLFSNPISDGGQFTGVSNLVMKYGVVPADVMPETLSSNSTSQLRTHLSTYLRKSGLQLRAEWDATSEKDRKKLGDSRLQEMKLSMLKDVYHVLSLTLGVPPTSFTWTRYDSKGKAVSTKEYTPKSYYDEFIGTDLNNTYVMLMNDPVREYYKVYEIDYDRHVYDGQNWVYLNLPIERIKEMAIASIKDGTAMYFSCDVGKFLDRPRGIADLKNFNYDALLGVDLKMDKKQRVQTHASGSSHAMTLIAVDLKDGVPQKWMVENSWGATSGYKGNIIMTDEWFNEYMFRLVVEKRFLPADLLPLLDTKPILLPAWDPMFLPEE